MATSHTNKHVVNNKAALFYSILWRWYPISERLRLKSDKFPVRILRVFDVFLSPSRPDVHKLSRDLEATSKFLAPYWGCEKLPDWDTANIRRHGTKFSRYGDLAPGICAPLLQANVRILPWVPSRPPPFTYLTIHCLLFSDESTVHGLHA
jgi:hypothetical protein